MSTARFRIQEHTLPASHIREYARSTSKDQEDVLHIAIKQYTPIESSASGEGDVTIIGAHANAFPKELYEPLWDDLYDCLKAKGLRIRSVWIADVAHQGQSGVLNEDKIGNDPCWMDHARDLLLMVNHFREHMKRPLIGFGHSMGGNNLINLSLMHPRLFTTLILCDPVCLRAISIEGGAYPAIMSMSRRDRWPTRQAAEAAFKRSKFMQTWDPRVLDKWLEHGLRDLPTLIYDDASSSSKGSPSSSPDSKRGEGKGVTLKTTRHQEVISFLRGIFPTAEYPSPRTEPNPVTHPDVDPSTYPHTPFYRPEVLNTFANLPHLRPSVLYLFADKSALSDPRLIADKLEHTGTGVGGSGGAKKGRVMEHTFKGVGHLIPMEAASQTADVCTSWIVPELTRWREIEDAERREWSKVPDQLKPQISPEFRETMLSDWTTKAMEEFKRLESKL